MITFTWNMILQIYFTQVLEKCYIWTVSQHFISGSIVFFEAMIMMSQAKSNFE